MRKKKPLHEFLSNIISPENPMTSYFHMDTPRSLALMAPSIRTFVLACLLRNRLIFPSTKYCIWRQPESNRARPDLGPGALPLSYVSKKA